MREWSCKRLDEDGDGSGDGVDSRDGREAQEKFLVTEIYCQHCLRFLLVHPVNKQLP